MYPQYPVYVQPTAQTYLYVNTATTHVCYRQCSVSKCIGIQHVVVAPGALITGHMANPHPFLPHHSRPGVGPTNESVFHFVVLPQSTGTNLR